MVLFELFNGERLKRMLVCFQWGQEDVLTNKVEYAKSFEAYKCLQRGIYKTFYGY